MARRGALWHGMAGVMGVNRIEVAVDCDDLLGEGLQAVAMIAATFGLTASDVTTSVAPAVDGTPVLFAVLQVQPNHEESQ